MELPNLFNIAPDYLTGLLGQEGAQKLQNRANTTGLVNMAVGYLAQPKNQGFGSAIPYLARSYIAGQEGAQQTVNDVLRQSALQEQALALRQSALQRQQDREMELARQNKLQGFVSEIQDPRERMLAELDPASYVKNKMTPVTRQTATVNGVLVDTQTGQPIYGTPELKALPTRDRQVGRVKIQEELQPDGTWREIGRGSMDAPKQAESVSYKTETDAEGNLVYVPNKAGYAVLNQRGQPVDYKPAPSGGKVSEGERKSATLLKRMEGSLNQLNTALQDSSRTGQDVSKPSLLASGFNAVGLNTVGNVLTGKNRQRVEAAQLDILDAALTLGTGAAYTKEQLEGYRKSYFPQIGDDPATVADKQMRLNNVIEAAKIAAGNALPPQKENILPQGATMPSGWSIKKK